MKIHTGKRTRPRKVLIYGTHGLGKSTFLAGLPGHLILPTEDGLGDIDCRAFDVAKSYGDVLEALGVAKTELHAGEWFCLDSLDWLYRVSSIDYCRANGLNSLGDVDYGKGYQAVASDVERVLRQLDELNAAGINICCTAHCQITRFEPPGHPAYDRYEPRLQKAVSGMVQEWFDEVLFVNYQVSTSTEKGDFGKERQVAKGSGKRVMHTCEMPGHLAKRRLPLPDVMPFSAQAYLDAVAGMHAKTTTQPSTDSVFA